MKPFGNAAGADAPAEAHGERLEAVGQELTDDLGRPFVGGHERADPDVVVGLHSIRHGTLFFQVR